MKVEFNIISDTPNANGIIYQRDALRKAIKKYNEDYVKTGKALGELGQPKDTMPDVHNIAFKVNEIEFEDEHWNAEIEILETSRGKELQEIINKGDYRIVTMGVGEIEKVNNDTIIKKFKIVGVGIEPKENCA